MAIDFGGIESGFEEIGGYVEDVQSGVQRVGEAKDALFGSGGAAGGDASQSWMIDPSKYPSGSISVAAGGILSIQKNIASRGGTLEDIFKIASLSDTAGLAPMGTPLTNLPKIGQVRMLQNMYIIAACKFRNSPAQFEQYQKMLNSEKYALGFPQLGRGVSCSPTDLTPDGYRSIKTNEVCTPRFIPVTLSTDTRPFTRPTNDAIARLLAVARGQISESGIAGSPGDDPLLGAMAAQTGAPSAEECFDRTVFSSPDERLGCIDDYEALSPGTKERLLRTHKPWEAAMVEGKFAQMATGLNDQRYVVYGKQPPGFGISLRLAGATAVAGLAAAWWWLYKTKKGASFRKKRLKLK
jgi:hypothetical protein